MSMDENCKSQEEGQVIQELNKVEESSGRLMAIIDTLEKQLSIVLHEATPSVNDAAKQPEKDFVPLARRIHSHYKLLQQQGTRLENVMERLEIR